MTISMPVKCSLNGCTGAGFQIAKIDTVDEQGQPYSQVDVLQCRTCGAVCGTFYDVAIRRLRTEMQDQLRQVNHNIRTLSG